MSNEPSAFPAIVIVAANRAASLQRLLTSIERAHFPVDADISLVISIDNSPRNDESIATARRFRWKWGKTEVFAHDKHLGLKEHVLRCGDVTSRFSSVILLEDDLYVSPQFYLFAMACLERYGSDTAIGGVSLYSFAFNECAETPFAPIDDGSDVYFLQSGSSWGALWTKPQWMSFRSWFEERRFTGTSRLIPRAMNGWSESSWKRLLNIYLAETGKYWVVPRSGLSTNLAEPGVHVSQSTTHLSSYLGWGFRHWRLPDLSNSLCRYDPFFQLEVGSLRAWSSDALPRSLELDLYGQKYVESIAAEWIITIRDRGMRAVERGFGLHLFPFELNIMESISGNYFALLPRKYVSLVDRDLSTTAMKRFFMPWWHASSTRG